MNPFLLHDRDVDRAELAADAAGDACCVVTGHLCRRKYGEQPQEGTVRAEEPAEGISDRERQQQENEYEDKRESGEIQEEIEQPCIGYLVVVRGDEANYLLDRHLYEDEVDEKGKQQIFRASEDVVEPFR